MPKRLLSLFVVIAFAAGLSAQTRLTFPDGKHKAGEMKHVGGLAVLTVRGTPDEMGEQLGVLAVKAAPGLDGLRREFLKDSKQEDAYDGIKLLARQLKKNFPKDHLVEMDAAAKHGGQEADLLYFANTVYDLSSGMGCSTVVVEPGRSKTGAPLFGRNFDWLPSKGIDDHTLVIVYQPKGKKAFATVTICPITGCISGMNEDGLAVTINQIQLNQSKDKPAFNWKGTPTLALYRRVLEECGSVAEAEELLKKSERTSTSCMTICDPKGGAVFEISPKAVATRRAVNDVCCCTNHFRTDLLGVGEKCPRMTTLLPLQKGDATFGVSDVFASLDGVNLGKDTLQSMVFEPKARALHLKLGDLKAPATKKEAVTLELAKLFKN